MEFDQNKNEIYWKILQKQVQEQRIEQLFCIFREHGFEPILIKGWAAARNYPEPYQRLSADIDIAVNPSEYALCQKLLAKQTIANVDLHCGLRHLDTVDWDDLYENSQLITLNRTEVRILCPEDHLRILCVHWLADGGVSKERLWDIFYAVKHRPDNFNWDRCLKIVSETRTEWIIQTIGLAVRYLNLNVEDTPIFGMAVKHPIWLIKTIEKEWKDDVKLKPLHHCLEDRQELFRQIVKRLPPNPIQATVEMNGKFDEKRRSIYQIGSLIFRFLPSIKRISETFWQKCEYQFRKIKNNEQL